MAAGSWQLVGAGAGRPGLDITEAVLTCVTSSEPGGPVDLLIIESWHPGVGHWCRTRA